MTTSPITAANARNNRCDIDDAAELAFALFNELGLNTGDLVPSDFQAIVRPLLAALSLRVATEERLERERDDLAQLDHIETTHATCVRRRLRNLNGIRTADDLPW